MHGQQSHEEKDLYRDTPLRYLGYANEVGESFRQLVSIKLVRLSYIIASTYCLADASSKAKKIINDDKPSYAADATRRRAIEMFVEAVIWQGLASVIIPGFTINRICWFTSHFLSRSLGTLVPTNKRKLLTTTVGLGSIPVIIQPIDNLVDIIMEEGIDISKQYGFTHQLSHDEKMHVVLNKEQQD